MPVVPELLAPAGDLEKLRFAYAYGADAAYIGGGDFSLRSNAGCGLDVLAEACSLARRTGKKLYVAVNIYADNHDIAVLPSYLENLAELQPDGLLISDPGVFRLAQQYAPRLPIHISTQANNTNWLSARFWAEQGASRIVLARELSIAEGAEIAQRSGLEAEIFVHGAICISYSGRCLISQFLTGRSANRGDCSHPCRWQYVVEEEKRPGEYFPVEEDARGSYFFNSRDLCLLAAIPQLVAGGFSAWKIEGRNKSAYYVANVVRVYRAALDAYLRDPDGWRCRSAWLEELTRVSHRGYTTGFAFGLPDADAYRYDDGSYLRSYDFTAVALEMRDGLLWLEQRNHFAVGDVLELLLPDATNIVLPVKAIYDENGCLLNAARHPRMQVAVDCGSLPVMLPFPLICRRAVRES